MDYACPLHSAPPKGRADPKTPWVRLSLGHTPTLTHRGPAPLPLPRECVNKGACCLFSLPLLSRGPDKALPQF